MKRREMKRRAWLVTVYPYSGDHVYSQRVFARNQPTYLDILELERLLKGKIELKVMSNW